jgi:hypothetical protein
MKISATSTSTSQTWNLAASGDNVIQGLEKQEKELNKEIDKELTGKDDAKTKEEKVQILRARIQVIEMQIEAAKAKKKSAQGDGESGGKDGTQGVSDLLSSAVKNDSALNIVA